MKGKIINLGEIPEPFGGEGPINLPDEQLRQAWNLTVILDYQRKVRELTERLQQEEREINE